MTKKQLFWWIILLLLIAALVGGITYAVYYFYYLPNQQPAETENPPAEEGPQTQTFSGEFVTGETPQGWTIVEYKNGQGTTMLTSGVNYTGLTALEVKNPTGDVVFALHAVYGIGGAGGCTNYYRFSDDSTTYYNSILAENSAAGSNPPTIVDLTNSTSSSISLFGLRIRRIAAKLYWDTQSAEAATFSAACGMSENTFQFTSPQFVPGTQAAEGDYHFVVLTTATSEDLITLDSILNSLTVNP